eukprot:8639780-Pyramimonas_sp.AAC.1
MHQGSLASDERDEVLQATTERGLGFAALHHPRPPPYGLLLCRLGPGTLQRRGESKITPDRSVVRIYPRLLRLIQA